ncbi:MAG TPA: RNA polymerase sigma factor [Candidatus Saccharibacteria bacterium]|nr:RNA polymerase sigma factor [Candidatus Saccharibacteria bacterium]
MKLEQFYDEHVDKVYKFFYIKCLDRSTAEDLTSETFTLFIEQLEHQTITDNKKYLYGIMRNTWLQFLRKKYQQALVDIENIEDFAGVVEHEIADFDEARDVGNRLLPYIERLPEKQRLVITKRLLEEKSVADIATELGKDKNYVKTTYKRGLTSLRAILTVPYMEGSL